MANTVIQLKKSGTASAVPSSLANGELAINYADGKLFYKHSNGTVLSFSSGGDSFGTINANGTLVVADTPGDVLNLVAGNNITFGVDTVNDKITINSDDSTKLSNTSGVTFGGDLTITGNVGIGTAQTSSFRLEVGGAFAATTKSFIIDHPTKPGRRLRYASLEGPENGVYIRGKSYSNVIELPDYWKGLVDEDTITAHITPFGAPQNLYVWRISNNIVYVEGSEPMSYYYAVFAERKDVDKLIVEI